MKLPILITVSIVTWVVHTALFVPLAILGIPICYVLAKREAWVPSTSNRPDKRPISVWKYSWAWLWSNDEDGVEGHPFWHERMAGKPRWLRAFLWSAMRNPLNNLRYVPILNPRINPKRIGWVGNLDVSNDIADSPGDEFNADEILGAQPRKVYWCYVWQFPYTGLWYMRRRDNDTHFRLRVGWKLLPKDRFGVSPDDYRSVRCGFGLQFTVRRQG